MLQDDETLWELLDTPLILSIVTLAYRDRSAAEVRATGSLEERRAHLFAKYTERMFERRTKPTEYTREQTIRWLAWLARSLKRNNPGVFYLEWMQPEWLHYHAPRFVMAVTTTAFYLFIGLVYGLVAGLVGALAGMLVIGLVFGVVGGLVFGLVSGLVFGLVSGLVFGLVSALADQLVGGLGGWLILGLGGGLVSGLVSVLVDYTYSHRITPAESLGWSWNAAGSEFIFKLIAGLVAGLAAGLTLGLGDGLVGVLVGGLVGVLGGVLVGVLGGVLVGALVGGLDSVSSGMLIDKWSFLGRGGGLVVGLIAGLFGGLIAGLFGGLIAGLVTNQIATRTMPNEGIRRSLRSALISFLAIWLGAALILWQIIGPEGLPYGLVGGLISGMNNGGHAYVKHYVLRFLVWRNDYAPLNYIRFLDYAAERVFLRKVGGGYIFTHRLLMEYFATLEPNEQAGRAKAE